MCPTFTVRLEDGRARFEMKEHFATADDAREHVAPFIRSWVLIAELEGNPGDFSLVFDAAEVVDRAPEPGKVMHAEAGLYFVVGMDAALHVGRARYPAPPVGLTVDPDVEVMDYRYALHRQGHETLGATAYFCATVLEAAAERQGALAAEWYGVSRNVLSKLRELSTKRGGRDARKADGIASERSRVERAWLHAALKAIIRRAAEVAHDPDQRRPRITMADLPPL